MPPKPTPKPPTPPTNAPPPVPGNGGNLPAPPVKIVTGEAGPVPNRIVLNAVEGWGKTTMAAHTPKPLILMAAGETGYETLLANKLVPMVHRATIPNWPQTLSTIDALIENCPYKTIVLDALSGFERMCHAEVCRREFKGNWGEKGFLGYQRGYLVAENDWTQLLKRLDDLIAAHGPDILILSHCQIKNFKNPLGPDFDRYVADVQKQTWAPTIKWVDAVLFGNFFANVETDKPDSKRGKGTGGDVRVIYTQRRDSYDAKNRHNMPELIEISNDRTKSWATLAQHLNGAAK